ncbi:MAG: LemA family protein [Patescibacteria group bacterium]|nr:LemA family protein [Patescibacteria group bacterium]MCL5262061.1 LemA family protein [Patescibacteria group bacterium]
MYILWGIIALILIWIAGSYNGLVVLKIRVKEALSDIDVQLKRRFDLIPNLVETVKGYMTHEAAVLEKVTAARASVAENKGSPLERDKAENVLSGTLKTLFAVAENYPELKANVNFIELQRELSDTEDKIQASRRFYNSNVREINIRVQRFPTNIIARLFGFRTEPFFETAVEEKEPVKVQF